MLTPTSSVHSFDILIDSKVPKRMFLFSYLKLKINASCVGLRWRRVRWMAPLAWCLLATTYHLDTETILIFLCGIVFANTSCKVCSSQILQLPLFCFFFLLLLGLSVSKTEYLYWPTRLSLSILFFNHKSKKPWLSYSF